MHPERLTHLEAAEYLGITGSTLNVWRCTGRHQIPYYKIGSKVLYEKADLDAWLSSRKVSTGV